MHKPYIIKLSFHNLLVRIDFFIRILWVVVELFPKILNLFRIFTVAVEYILLFTLVKLYLRVFSFQINMHRFYEIGRKVFFSMTRWGKSAFFLRIVLIRLCFYIFTASLFTFVQKALVEVRNSSTWSVIWGQKVVVIIRSLLRMCTFVIISGIRSDWKGFICIYSRFARVYLIFLCSFLSTRELIMRMLGCLLNLVSFGGSISVIYGTLLVDKLVFVLAFGSYFGENPLVGRILVLEGLIWGLWSVILLDWNITYVLFLEYVPNIVFFFFLFLFFLVITVNNVNIISIASVICLI